jgi:hypothetical protein
VAWNWRYASTSDRGNEWVSTIDWPGPLAAMVHHAAPCRRLAIEVRPQAVDEFIDHPHPHLRRSQIEPPGFFRNSGLVS